MKCQPTYAFVPCLVLAVGLVTSACTKQETSSDDGTPSGVYALVSVDGKDVPTSISHEGASLEVRSGTFTILDDGTCSSRTVFIPPSGPEVAREVTATYTRDGSELTMQWEGAGKTVGTLEDDTFTMDNEGIVFVYRK